PKIEFLGYVKPAELAQLTANAFIGLNLLENKGLSYYYSLANKFFDYIQAAVPSLNMDFPEYRHINEQYEVSVLLSELNPEPIDREIKRLADDKDLYERLRQQCLRAKKEYHWEKEQTVLLNLFDDLVSG